MVLCSSRLLWLCWCRLLLMVVWLKGRCMVLCVWVWVYWKFSCGWVGRLVLVWFRVICVGVSWCSGS